MRNNFNKDERFDKVNKNEKKIFKLRGEVNRMYFKQHLSKTEISKKKGTFYKSCV